MKRRNHIARNEKLIDRNFWRCILLCFVIAFFSFIYFIAAGKGAFTLRDDFNTQQLTFPNQVNGFLKQADPGEWCWNLEIGASFVNGFGFYVLGSPFSWITYLFPRTMLPYLIGWVYMLKYAVAGGTAYLYLKYCTGKGEWQEVFGAVMYAFSGFSAAAIEFYHFHDVVALFPLLLLGLEKLIRDDDKRIFTGAVFINCLVNYYFFIGQVIFCVLYFLFRHFSDKKSFLSDTLKCLLCGCLGVGMAGVLFVPSIIYILGNPRTDSRLTWRTDIFPIMEDFLYFVKGILLPGEAMSNQSAIYNAEWNSTACWLPLCGISLCIAYILKKRNRLSAFLVLLTVISFSPYLSSGFSLFTRNYQRWWYMFVLIGVLASVYVLKNPESYPVRTGILCNAGLLAAYYLFVRLSDKKGTYGQLIWHPRRFLFLVAAAGAGLVFLYIVITAVKKHRGAVLVAGLSACACLMTAFVIYIYRIHSESTESIMGKYALAQQLDVIDDQYRYELEDNANLLTLTGDIGGVGAFTSTCSNCRFEFNEIFEHYSSIFSIRKDETPGLAALFGAKFVLKEGQPEAAPVHLRAQVNGTDWYVTEQPACPIGYSVDHYILKSDLFRIALKDRGIALLHAIVINDEEEALVSPYLERKEPGDMDLAEDLSVVIERNIENGVHDFERDSHGFACASDYEKDTVVFFSVPNEPGWKVTIDDAPAQTINTGGLTALAVPAGAHEIRFVYHTPGLRAGALLSAVSFLVLIGVWVVGRKKRG